MFFLEDFHTWHQEQSCMIQTRRAKLYAKSLLPLWESSSVTRRPIDNSVNIASNTEIAHSSLDLQFSDSLDRQENIPHSVNDLQEQACELPTGQQSRVSPLL